ncbi:hypothetical protein ACFVJ5_16180 [Nocardia sp. NPDC127606]|uniref:hypothetical protein n=1 Tax=Nocardia sp. NPDC127606 TaxID=3345406 RepID=UPI003645E9BB
MNDQGPSLEPAPQQTDPPAPAFVPTMPPTVAQTDVDPFTQLAPEIPGLDAPDAIFALTPGTAAQLARHNALRAAPRYIGIVLAIAVPTSTIALLWIGLPLASILVLQSVVVAYVLVVMYFSLRRQFRSLSRSDVTTGSCAIALGDDALDLAEGSSRTRIGYDRIRTVRATRRVVTLSFDNRHLALPRPLFPDAPLTQLRLLIATEPSPRPSALPPFPRLPQPQVHTVIAADTARRLTIARRLEPWRRASGQLATVLLLVEAGAFGALEFGIPGALSALVIALLFGLTVRFWMRRPSENALRQYQGLLPVASGLAAQFGTDAAVLGGATFLLRAPYSIVTKVVVRADCAVLNYGKTALVYPRALFPPEICHRLRELGVTVVER